MSKYQQRKLGLALSLLCEHQPLSVGNRYYLSLTHSGNGITAIKIFPPERRGFFSTTYIGQMYHICETLNLSMYFETFETTPIIVII